ncbi:MAG: class I SAM-dependent methyltransferase [Patescibacteria group bacterium]
MTSFLKELNSLLFGKTLQEREINENFRYFTHNLNEQSRILEIGCGRGEAIRELIKHLRKEKIRPEEIIVSDVDTRDLIMAEKNVRKEKNLVGKLSFRREDATRLNFPDGHFDLVYGFSVLHHIDNWRSAIKEISRVLKNKGRYIMAEHTTEFFSLLPIVRYFDRATGFFSESELKQEFLKSKLQPILWEYRGFYKKFFKGSLRVVAEKVGNF